MRAFARFFYSFRCVFVWEGKQRNRSVRRTLGKVKDEGSFLGGSGKFLSLTQWTSSKLPDPLQVTENIVTRKMFAINSKQQQERSVNALSAEVVFLYTLTTTHTASVDLLRTLTAHAKSIINCKRGRTFGWFFFSGASTVLLHIPSRQHSFPTFIPP